MLLHTLELVGLGALSAETLASAATRVGHYTPYVQALHGEKTG